LAAPIFAYLWNVNEDQLVTSMDGISFHIAPEHFPNYRGKYRGNDWFHTDQSYLTSYGRCIQGFWNIIDVEPDYACLQVLKSSHQYHNDFFNEFLKTLDKKEIKGDWYKLNENELSWYVEEKKCQKMFICPPKGCFVIWDSRLIHCGKEPNLPRNNPKNRLIFYVSMLPKIKTNHNGYYSKGITPKQIEKRIKAFEEKRVTTHWAYPPKLFPKNPRTFGKPIQVQNVGNMEFEDLSYLQKKLIGYNNF